MVDVRASTTLASSPARLTDAPSCSCNDDWSQRFPRRLSHFYVYCCFFPAQLSGITGWYGVATVCSVFCQLETLEGAHKLGWIIVDLKPDNVMLGRGAQADEVFVIDWGCAMKYLDFTQNFAEGGDHGGNDLYRSLFAHSFEGARFVSSVGYCGHTCSMSC